MQIIRLLGGRLVPDWRGIRTLLNRVRPAGVDVPAQSQGIE